MSLRQQMNAQNKRKLLKSKNINNKKLEKISQLNTDERKKMYDDVKNGDKVITDPVEKAILDANKLWDDIKQKVKDGDEFCELDDNKKVEYYQGTEFKQFYTTYPIVCRYMICMGQFSTKAFRRFLVKSVNFAKQPVSREKGYNEEQWIQRQADYIRYLWESYQNVHFDKKDSNNIWDHAYKMLKKEFADFRKMHEDISAKLKEDKKLNKKELVKEMIERMSDKDEELSKELLEKLKGLKKTDC